MGNGEWDRKPNGRTTPHMAGTLTPEQIQELNAGRPPSERIGLRVICGAKAKVSKINPNGVCTKTAGQGTPHVGVGYCKHHGGNTPAGLKSAARLFGRQIIDKEREVLADESRADVLERFGGDRTLVNITPEEALLEEVRRSVALVRWLEERIAEWQWSPNPDVDPDDPAASPLRWNPDSPPPRPALGGLPALLDETSRGAATFTDEREWLLLYRQEREHATKVAKMAIDAGVAQRMVTLAEDQGRMLASAIRAVLDALSLTPQQAQLVPQVVPGVLRSVTQGIPLPAATPTTPR